MNNTHIQYKLKRIFGTQPNPAHNFDALAHITTDFPDTTDPDRGPNGEHLFLPKPLQELRPHFNKSGHMLYLDCPLKQLRETQRQQVWSDTLPPVYSAIARHLRQGDYIISFHPDQPLDYHNDIALLKNSHLVRELTYDEIESRLYIDSHSASRMFDALHPFPLEPNHMFRDPDANALSPQHQSDLNAIFKQHASDAQACFSFPDDTVPPAPMGENLLRTLKQRFPSPAVDTLLKYYPDLCEQFPSYRLQLPLSAITEIALHIHSNDKDPRPPKGLAAQILAAIQHQEYTILWPLSGTEQNARELSSRLNHELLDSAPPSCIEMRNGQPFLLLTADQHATLALLWARSQPRPTRPKPAPQTDNIIPIDFGRGR